MTQALRPADRKIRCIRSAARALAHDGDQELADLLFSIANAYEQFRTDDPALLDEAMRWTPVFRSAMQIARGVLR